MKVIITGSKNINNPKYIQEAIKKSGFNIKEVVSSMAMGVDYQGELWAKNNNIPIKYFPLDWDAHKESAELIRNDMMAKYADALIFIGTEKDKNSNNIKEFVEKYNKPYYELIIKE